MAEAAADGVRVEDEAGAAGMAFGMGGAMDVMGPYHALVRLVRQVDGHIQPRIVGVGALALLRRQAASEHEDAR